MEQRELARLRRNWRAERDSAALYGALAALERNPGLRGLFSRLAAAEHEHSRYWEERLQAAGGSVPGFRPSLATRVMILLARTLGTAVVIPRITTRELGDHRRYTAQPDARDAGLPHQERAHAAILRRIAAYGARSPVQHGAEAGPLGRLANVLRAAVLGANDGLVSNFCLLMGVAGAGMSARNVAVTGVAGLVAGACSMALGEWLSVSNAREMARSQVDDDAGELHAGVLWQREQLTLMHQARGLTAPQAEHEAERILAHDVDAIQSLIGEEHALAAAAGANDPLSAALYSFLLFALGALLPLLPFLVSASTVAVLASIGVSLLALLGLGMLTSFFNGRSPGFAGLRQLVIGALAAAVTYSAGHLVARALG